MRLIGAMPALALLLGATARAGVPHRHMVRGSDAVHQPPRGVGGVALRAGSTGVRRDGDRVCRRCGGADRGRATPCPRSVVRSPDEPRGGAAATARGRVATGGLHRASGNSARGARRAAIGRRPPRAQRSRSVARSRRSSPVEWRAGRIIETFATFRRPARYLDDGVPDFERDLALAGTAFFGSIKSGWLVDVQRSAAVPCRRPPATIRAHVRRSVQSMGGAARRRRGRDRHCRPDRRSHRVCRTTSGCGCRPRAPITSSRSPAGTSRSWPVSCSDCCSSAGISGRPAACDHAAPACDVRAGRDSGRLGLARDAHGDALSRRAADRSPEPALARPGRGGGRGDLRAAARRARRRIHPDIRSDRGAARRRAARQCAALAARSSVAAGVADGLARGGGRPAADQRVDVLACDECRARC